MSESNAAPRSTPIQGWLAVIGGISINLCLGILYAWSAWKLELSAKSAGKEPGQQMPEPNQAWQYLSDSEATWAYSICGLMFAVSMIPGGRIQDRWGPKIGATLSGIFLATGCCLVGWMASFTGLIIGFGILGGIGMGLGYSAATPAAVKWFGPERRGLIIGLVVAGFGAAVIYISPLASWLIKQYGISGSFWTLGIFFSAVIIGAAQLLNLPPPGYLPATKHANPDTPATASSSAKQWTPSEMIRTWQFWAIALMFVTSAQSGLLFIAELKGLVTDKFPLLSPYAWLVLALTGVPNALGRVGTGMTSDRIGRRNTFLFNAILAMVCILLLPWVIANEMNVAFCIIIVVVYWQYGGGLALMPAWTADFFGQKNLGMNYGLVFLGWGVAFFIPSLATYLPDPNDKIYLNVGLLALGCVLCCILSKPTAPEIGS